MRPRKAGPLTAASISSSSEAWANNWNRRRRTRKKPRNPLLKKLYRQLPSTTEPRLTSSYLSHWERSARKARRVRVEVVTNPETPVAVLGDCALPDLHSF